MWINLENNSIGKRVNLNAPIDISIPLQTGVENPNAWYTKPPKIEAEKNDDWVGAVAEGGSVNFNKITFNPHAHGTHTECVGHITSRKVSIQDCLKTYFFISELITVAPKKIENDFQIGIDQLLEYEEELKEVEAIIIRTMPNSDIKKTQQYNHTNWAYITEEATAYLAKLNIKHLLIDLPSVDKEKDDGKLLAHKAFWQHPENTRLDATITELIYVPNTVIDGTYLLNIQIASFVNDASPSKPVLYMIEN